MVFSNIQFSYASETNGTIDSTYKYAWGENIGWINFGCAECDVEVTDAEITGYGWSAQYGWINLAPTNGGVTNDAEGTLAGRAWGSSTGWIDFDGVTINDSGEFVGYATLDLDSSQINFNCANGASCASADFKVKTDWRKESLRSSGSGGDSGGNTSGSIPRPFVSLGANVIDAGANAIASIGDFITDFFDFGDEPDEGEVVVPEVAPNVLAFKWNLLPAPAIRSFVFAPLPREIRILASQFPDLERTLVDVGVTRFSDLNKLTGAELNLPGLADILSQTIKRVAFEELGQIKDIQGVGLNLPGISDDGSLPSGDLDVDRIALVEGLPVAEFSSDLKKNLPTEFVFARTGGELVDLSVALSVSERGNVTQQISALPGKVMKLVVKPIARANSVTGYIFFNSATPKVSQNSPNNISRASLAASALFSMEGLVEQVANTLPEVEQKFVLSSFEYTDEDGDGIYTADVMTPVVPGEYEIVTIIDYVDPELGSRKMSLITVIDPEGYVYEERDGKETRIPRAVVSLYVLNNSTREYELWNAEKYIQDNPQVTDVRGTYSFLVPTGTYHFLVEAPGYKIWQGEPFVVAEGNGVHENIRLTPEGGIFTNISVETALLVVVAILLVYNLYRSRLRDELLNNLSKSNV